MITTGLGSLQGVIFINNFDLSDKLGVAQSLNALRSIKFDGSPTILPIPADAPVEIPRIILRTSDNRFNLNVSIGRIDLFYNNIKFDSNGTPVGNISNIESDMVSALVEIVDLVINKFSAQLLRLALVANHVIKLDTSSKKYLTDNFIKNGIASDSKEIQVNFLMNKIIGKYKLNEWLRFHTLRNQKNLTDDSALLFILDLNTLAEVNYNFDKISAKDFFKSCFSILKNEVEQYTKGDKYNG